MTEIDTDKLRALDERIEVAKGEGLGMLQAATAAQREYLGKNSAAILAMAEENKRLREALERIAEAADRASDNHKTAFVFTADLQRARRALGKDKA